jgi:hypothetical protein
MHSNKQPVSVKDTRPSRRGTLAYLRHCLRPCRKSWIRRNLIQASAQVIYVGTTKARRGLTGRLGCFFDFGMEQPVGHLSIAAAPGYNQRTALGDVKQEIEEERARIVALDSTSDVTRTPIAKAQLRLALSFLNDADSALRGNFNGDTGSAIWIQLATDCLRRATEKRQEVYAATRGGADDIFETGG